MQRQPVVKLSQNIPLQFECTGFYLQFSFQNTILGHWVFVNVVCVAYAESSFLQMHCLGLKPTSYDNYISILQEAHMFPSADIAAKRIPFIEVPMFFPFTIAGELLDTSITMDFFSPGLLSTKHLL